VSQKHKHQTFQIELRFFIISKGAFRLRESTNTVDCPPDSNKYDLGQQRHFREKGCTFHINVLALLFHVTPSCVRHMRDAKLS
jgi:hypothetical protein